ncbi:phosphomannomutase [Coccinella septempunctata]|uniref:phosphomannomutase n=1 Tax=Coccinella septempunctata TaxID=41139 RepID=UPI001D08225E|nr:phosphomannomutase [Coccinella septempunctata]
MEPNTKRESIICLFDVDGTLTKPRNKISDDMEDFLLNRVKPLTKIGLVGGSDFQKISEQMNGDSVLLKYDYVFPENGLISFKNGKETCRQSIQRFMGEEVLQKFINFVLKYLSTVTLPVKRGTFVEFRNGMLNISPIGRSCSQAERDAFEQYDKTHNVRKQMIDALKAEFPDIGFTYSIGGQISFDVFPVGWDKTYCLKHLEEDGFQEIHFFGDKTHQGGNDYEIYSDSRTIGHTVKNPEDTKETLMKLFNL